MIFFGEKEKKESGRKKGESSAGSAIYQWRILSLSPRGFPFWAKKQSWSGSR
jgi:hypothetical protein